MNRKRTLLFILALAAFSLSSCSGLPKGNGGVGGGGNAAFTLTMTDTNPVGSSILSFSLTVTGASVISSTGTQVPLTLSPASPTIELTRLQSDSALLGTSASLASGTYTGIVVAFSSPDIVLVNQTGGTLTGALSPCPNNAVCEFKPIAAGSITFSVAPFPITVSGGGKQGISLDFNLSNVITATNGTINVDFTQAKVLTASTLPRAGTPSGALDLIEDFTGIITKVSGNNVTVQSGTRGTITAVANSSTTFNIDPTVCPAQNLTCLAANKTVSIDASVNTDGALTLLEADLLDNVAVDEVEGTVWFTDLGLQNIDIVLSDKTVVSGNALLAAAAPGTILQVTLGTTPAFSVDTKGLSALASAPSAVADFASLSNVSLGQVVRMQVTNPAQIVNSTAISATTNSVVLRFSHVTAQVSVALAGSFFSINAATLPAYIAGTGNVPVQTSSQTQVDGAADLTNLSPSSTVVSMRTLFIPNYLTSPFFPAKVRVH